MGNRKNFQRIITMERPCPSSLHHKDGFHYYWINGEFKKAKCVYARITYSKVGAT